ncbi:putative AbiEii toxin of type IV toxin-antitoxin system, partial [Azospirillum brasilense]
SILAKTGVGNAIFKPQRRQKAGICSFFRVLLAALENADPPIKAIGITDYYGLDCYRSVCDERASGRLAECDLIFPNIEMRLNVGTVRGAWVNVHLLVSPDDPEHIEQLSRFLARLTFDAHADRFCCRPDDLIRLGRTVDTTITSDRAALRLGSEQFKVSFSQLREEYRHSAWAQANILIAVAGGQGDGTSGVREAADQTLRQEVERFAHIIFASSAAQRDFWLGRRVLSAEEICRRYDSLKPCLHGSDGHCVEKSGVPDEARYSWIKGAAIFDSLRQACIDPAGRAYVGNLPPMAAAPSQVISSISLLGAPWAQTPEIALNPGLVAIVGARGSGKTALADIVAAGCDAHAENMPEQAFLIRAQEYLNDAKVKITWHTGEVETRPLGNANSGQEEKYSRARYLSQQFVDKLCSSHGMTDDLLTEVERVIFEAHPLSARDGAVDFSDLRELRSARHHQAREREEHALSVLSDRVSDEIGKIKLTESYRTQVKDRTQQIERLTSDRDKLVAKGNQERVERLQALTKAAEVVRNYVRHFNSREQQLLLVQDEVENFRKHRAPEELRELQERYSTSGIQKDAWAPFLTTFSGDVDDVLNSRLKETRRSSTSWSGTKPPAPPDSNVPLVAADAPLEKQTLSLLEAEIERVQKLVTHDKETAQRFAALSTRIASENEALNKLKEKLVDCEGARDRLHALNVEREASYLRIFEAIVAEQDVLTDLYAPIRKRLEAASGTLRKLSFTVTRVADVQAWANKGEDLLDLRRQGPFKGRGTLCEAATKALKEPWTSGDAQAVAKAMKAFRDEHQASLLIHAPVEKSDQAEYRAWSRRFAQWLYGTDHIGIQYSVDYSGVDICKLSPGTRGIVLLLLYLALDDGDERPLIIDQPEENLDPQSIYEELVALFIDAKKRRQVIMVTHNANLVINTDADQIIVANAGPHSGNSLPPISYISGGFEDQSIRKMVCDILEGGERAFRERARRLRVRLER